MSLVPCDGILEPLAAVRRVGSVSMVQVSWRGAGDTEQNTPVSTRYFVPVSSSLMFRPRCVEARRLCCLGTAGYRAFFLLVFASFRTVACCIFMAAMIPTDIWFVSLPGCTGQSARQLGSRGWHS